MLFHSRVFRCAIVVSAMIYQIRNLHLIVKYHLKVIYHGFVPLLSVRYSYEEISLCSVTKESCAACGINYLRGLHSKCRVMKIILNYTIHEILRNESEEIDCS